MSYWHTLAMSLDEFIPAERQEYGLGVRVLQAALAVQTVFDLDWYDMLTVVSTPTGAVA